MRILRKIRLVLIILLILSIAFFFYFDNYISPLSSQVGLFHAKLLAYKHINNAINSSLSEIDVNYDDIVTVKYDENNNIKAIETDTGTINKIKSHLTLSVSDEIAKYTVDNIYIPLGSLTTIDCLSGSGPDISFSVHYGGCAVTDMVNEFYSAGINQTCHRIMVKVTVEVFIIAIGNTDSDTVECECCLAETIIVGSIPETYIDLNKK